MSAEDAERSLLRALQRHGDSLLGYARRNLPPDLSRLIDPEDVVSDVCYEAARRLPEFVALDDAAAERWLRTLTRYKLISTVRACRAAKRGQGQLTEHEAGQSSVILLLQELGVYSRTPSQSAMRHERALALQDSLNRIPAGQSDALRMRYLDGLTVAETAVRLGSSEDAVKMLCVRGLKSLRQALQSESKLF